MKSIVTGVCDDKLSRCWFQTPLVTMAPNCGARLFLVRRSKAGECSRHESSSWSCDVGISCWSNMFVSPLETQVQILSMTQACTVVYQIATIEPTTTSSHHLHRGFHPQIFFFHITMTSMKLLDFNENRCLMKSFIKYDKPYQHIWPCLIGGLALRAPCTVWSFKEA